jgi:PhzF family phenazine biosynthesis protein
VRYFSPAVEVPFCGHATIALGSVLALKHGDGLFSLRLNETEITVEGRTEDERFSAALHSPSTRSRPAPASLVSEVLRLFGYQPTDLDERIPPAIAHAGADHLIMMLNTREDLGRMRYELEAGRNLMVRDGLVTILFGFCETQQLFHTRNPFAYGGVYEDPATGAATAAFAGCLRDIGWPHHGVIDIVQGEDMGMRSRLRAEIPPETGRSIRVSGTARLMDRSAAQENSV